MPPAGHAKDAASKGLSQRPHAGTPQSLANQRYRHAQAGSGVAAALQSWGEWRQWADDDFHRPSPADVHSRPENPLHRQHAWDAVPDTQHSRGERPVTPGDAWQIPYDEAW